MSNVIEFKKAEPGEPVWEIPMTLKTQGDKLLMITVHQEDLTIGDKLMIAHQLFSAYWWVGRAVNDEGPEDPMDLVYLAAVHRGGRIRIYCPTDGNPDAYHTPEKQAWLLRKIMAAYQLALPSSSEEQPASGTTSPSHSANIDQLSFSW